MWRILILISLLFLAGCKTDLYRNLSEREANEMLAVLMSNGISASKEYLGDEGVTLQVEETDLPRAIDALKQNGLPRENRESLGQVFEKSGIMSSPFEERVRFVYALGEEVSKTLTEIDGVLNARVHIVLPEDPDLGEELKPSSAAVFIKHRVGVDLDFATPAIKRLVSGAIEGVGYDTVTVLLVEAEQPSLSQPPAEASFVQVLPGLGVRNADSDLFWQMLIGFGALVLLLFVSNIATMLGLLKARGAHKTAAALLAEHAEAAE